MAKLTALTEDTNPSVTDLAYSVKDPAGTPLSRKVTWQTVLNLLYSLTAKTTLTGADTFTITDSAASNVAKKITFTNLVTALGSYFEAVGGSAGQVVNYVYTKTGAMATGTTTVPNDDTIPQNTEGTEFMTLAITPANTANILKIEVVANVTASVAGYLAASVFQDSTAGALATSVAYNSGGATNVLMTFTHWMAAGTTSATTFKVRIGCNAAGTVTFNGFGGARKYGGVLASSITITEYLP